MVKHFLRLLPLISLFFHSFPAVHLAITANRGQEISVNGKAEVAVGQTFGAVVTVKSSGPLNDPTIAGFDQLTKIGRSSSSKFLMQNGAMTAERSFVYSVRADKEGEYIIGPAQITVDGKKESTERIKLTVKAESKTEKRGPAFIELNVNKQSVMVGEPLTVILKLYLQDGVELAQPLMANFSAGGWSVHSSQAKPATTKTIHANVYHVHEQHIVISSPISGAVVIPPLVAHCEVAQQNPTVFDLFGFGIRQTETFSVSTSPITITVKPLPEYKGTVHGMGQFSHFEASITTTHAQVGEGVVVRLTVEGTHDMQQVKAPTLKLPQGLTSYESNHHAQEISENRWRKTFEYIVQGLQPGTFTLPSQTFTYFDHAACAYKTLSTKPLRIHITGAPVVSTTPSTLPPKATVDVAVTPTAAMVPAPTPHHLVSYLWILLAVIFGSLFLGFVLYLLFKWLQKPVDMKATAFTRAKRHLAQLKKTNNITGIYPLFVQLFADRLQVGTGQVTEQWMQEILAARGMPSEKIDQWIHDAAAFCAAAYAPMAVREQLMVVAERWMRELGTWI